MAEAAAASGAVGDVEGGGSAGAVPVNAKAAKRAADVLDSMDRLVAEQQGRDPDAVKGREGKPVMAYGPDGVARPLELDSDTASEDPVGVRPARRRANLGCSYVCFRRWTPGRGRGAEKT